MPQAFTRVGHLKTIEQFQAHLASLGIELPMDSDILSAAARSPLAEPITIGRGEDTRVCGNRWCIHPMEGWDGTADGKPTEHTVRRWRRFGLSGAKLIWGGEAFAVQHDGRANPNQLYLAPDNIQPLGDMLGELLKAHQERFGTIDDLVVGLQLTHSGRFSRPDRKDKLEPRIAYHHPLLDRRFHIDPNDQSVVVSDQWIEDLIGRYIEAAVMARKLGFHFVDLKHCHGYFGHELLSAYDRPGKFGGDFEGRTRFLRQLVQGVRKAAPGLMIGVRLSIFDRPPYLPDPDQGSPGKLGPGIPDRYQDYLPYPGFGCNRQNPLELDLTEPIRLLEVMRDELGVEMVNISAGSPYYCPHIQRPAYFPPSDGYQPPEDPLVGCARQIDVVRQLKQAVPGLPMVGTGYTYFQEWTPHIAQAVVRQGWVDLVGLGRMVLAYPDLPADTLEHGELRQPKLICRTFSDCTTAPRNGIISGCYPLDDHYKQAEEHQDLKQAKAQLREKLKVI
ncbi:MAG: hypothetical protein JJU36_11275 [Phycisphaeraceae bacterium]|nr:hypothetical protein [Phycisphaeraceae bacterium]